MANLKIQNRMNGEVAIIDLDGRLIMGEDSATLRDRVRAVLAEGHKNILINLKDVTYVDSSGLGELVSAFATAKREDATVKLSSLTRAVKELLYITKLVTIFETFDTEEEAIRSFEPASAASTAQ